MRFDPRATGPIHFIGIGGIGMSGIAEVLVSTGFTVQGSDLAENANVARLRRLGCTVHVGHAPEHLGEARVVVVSSAVARDNPELVAARALPLPVVRRADMLAELMRLKRSVAVAGTHGKTTTTSMLAALFDAAGLDPTVINGGIINAYGTNARVGQGEWMVVEADESDGSFLRLPATVGVVTNIDPEHMEHYGTFEAVRAAYFDFLERLPFYGFGVLCVDHPEVQALYARVRDRRLVTYGFSPQADVQALNPVIDASGSVFDVRIRDRVTGGETFVNAVRSALPGHHNIANALAAVATARELGIAEAAIRRALADLKGVKRRFTVTGTVDGITVVDDYGHHPVEIAAVLKTARAAGRGRVIAVVQPHRYSRLRDLFEDFCQAFADADAVLVAPVYPAGEAPIPGVDHNALVKGLIAHGQREVAALAGPDDLPAWIDGWARSDDVVVCLGAGSITAWANALPDQLARRRGLEAA